MVPMRTWPPSQKVLSQRFVTRWRNPGLLSRDLDDDYVNMKILWNIAFKTELIKADTEANVWERNHLAQLYDTQFPQTFLTHPFCKPSSPSAFSPGFIKCREDSSAWGGKMAFCKWNPWGFSRVGFDLHSFLKKKKKKSKLWFRANVLKL